MLRRRIRSRAPRTALFSTLLVLIAAGCSETESPSDPDVDLPPVTDSEGTLPTVRNEPGDFTLDAHRTDLEIPAPPSGTWVLRDRESGSLITADGWAFEGPLAEAGVRLPHLAKTSAFWFAWSVFHPGSEIWGRDASVRDAVIRSDGDCLVPCDQIRRNLPRDAIPSLPNPGPPQGSPRFADAGSSDAAYLRPGDMVIGLFDGTEARAYPHNVLWWHEIVNATFGGQPLSVSFCPLTGSALVFSASRSAFGVSGNLYNSNLVLYDHDTASLFSQMRREAVTGERRGEILEEVPFVETTWERWQQMHPGTKVIASSTGFSRDYTRYPYGDYRSDDRDTFSVTDPSPDPQFPGKALVTGVHVGDVSRVYVHSEVRETMGNRTAFRDEVGGLPVWVLYDSADTFLQIVHAGDPEFELDLEWTRLP